MSSSCFDEVGLLKNAHTLKGTMVCRVALQTAPLNVYLYIRLAVRFFARLASEHF
jgi:hypothetical protein